MSREVTIEQGSGAPVADNCQVAVVGGFRQNLLDGANNPRLGNARRLPASDALLWVSKERVGRRLEVLLRKVTRRRSVILAEVVDDAVAVEPERVRENLCPLSRLSLAARENATHSSRPRPSRYCLHACSAALVERPIGDRDIGINCYIRVGDEENRRQL